MKQLTNEVQNLRQIIEDFQLNIAHYNSESNLLKQMIVYLYDYVGVYTDPFQFSRFKGRVLEDFIEEYKEFLKEYSLLEDTKEVNSDKDTVIKIRNNKKDYYRKLTSEERRADIIKYLENSKHKSISAQWISDRYSITIPQSHRDINYILKNMNGYDITFEMRKTLYKQTERIRKVKLLIKKVDNMKTEDEVPEANESMNRIMSSVSENNKKQQ